MQRTGKLKTKPQAPSRKELFAFYFLGFNPEGTYRFANAHHVARYYNVSSDAVLRWLDEMDMAPGKVLRREYDLAEAQLELQLDAPELTEEEFWGRVEAILAEVDQAAGGRRFWEDEG